MTSASVHRTTWTLFQTGKKVLMRVAMNGPPSRDQARAIVRDALARGAGMNAIIWTIIGAGMLLFAGLCVLDVVMRAREFGLLHYDKEQQEAFAAVPLLLGGTYLFLFRGVRSFGARGTRAGRVVLDFPERASVQPVVRHVSVNGVPATTAHFIAVTVDGGDCVEIRSSPGEMPYLLAAFGVWCGAAAVDARVLDMTGSP